MESKEREGRRWGMERKQREGRGQLHFSIRVFFKDFMKGRLIGWLPAQTEEPSTHTPNKPPRGGGEWRGSRGRGEVNYASVFVCSSKTL